MAYDYGRNKLVLFGGYFDSVNGPTAYLADTWEWDGSSWTSRSSGGPTGRSGASLAYDAVSGHMILYGGSNSYLNNSPYDNDTWEWNGTAGTWKKITAAHPGGREQHAMTYDPLHNQILLFGGFYQVENSYIVVDLGDLWIFQRPTTGLSSLKQSNVLKPTATSGR